MSVFPFWLIVYHLAPYFHAVEDSSEATGLFTALPRRGKVPITATGSLRSNGLSVGPVTRGPWCEIGSVRKPWHAQFWVGACHEVIPLA